MYVLDACALISVLNKEEGAELVRSILDQAKSGNDKIYMNKANLLEVYYGVLRECGHETAERILISVQASPIEISESLSDTVCRRRN